MKHLIFILALMLVLPGVANAKETRAEQQQEIQRMRADTLFQLYREKPGIDVDIGQSVGYAVFDNASLAAVFVSGGYGRGVAHDNRTGMETYMKMASAGVGLGLGVKDYRTVFVFNDASAFKNFINEGLDLSGQADVALKAGPRGDAIAGAADILPRGVDVYQLTEAGLLAQVMLQGTKYWRDDYLNGTDLSSDAGDYIRRNN